MDWKLYGSVPWTALPIHFFRHFCCRMYRLATKRSKLLNSWPASTADFSFKLWINKCWCWPWLFPQRSVATHTWYAVRSAITATTELLVRDPLLSITWETDTTEDKLPVVKSWHCWLVDNCPMPPAYRLVVLLPWCSALPVAVHKTMTQYQTNMKHCIRKQLFVVNT